MRFNTRALLTLSALVGMASGCSEPTNPASVARANTAPRVWAGPDQWVALPSFVLDGSATDAQSTIQSYSWTKISGPHSFFIEHPKAPRTRVTDLAPGTYKFELTGTDPGGLTGKDTVAVFVYDPRLAGENSVLFKGVQWSCPMSCNLLIENIQSHMPVGVAIRVFVREPSEAAVWIEVKPEGQSTANDRYWGFRIYDNKLEISADNETGAADVKVMF